MNFLIFRSDWLSLTGLALIGGLAACAAPAPLTGPATPVGVPQALQPPAGAPLVLKTHAAGVQIYTCKALKDDATHFEWALLAPEAKLLDPSGQSIGRHYAGPSWETADGSRVVGEVQARDPGPDPDAIPWLLLKAKSSSGSGVLGAVQWVQRLETTGGKAPGGCDAKEAGTPLRVPYQANYYFYSAAP